MSDQKKNNRHFSVDDVLAEAQSKRKANRQKTAADSIDPPKTPAPTTPEQPMPVGPAPTPEIPMAPQPEMPVQAPPPGQPGQVRFSGETEHEEKKGRRRGKRAKERFEETEDIYYGLHLKSAEDYRAEEEHRQESQASVFSYLFEEEAARQKPQMQPAGAPPAPRKENAETPAASKAGSQKKKEKPPASPRIVKSTIEDIPPAPKAPMPEKPPMPEQKEEPIVRYLEENPEKQRRSVTSPRIPKNISAKAQAKPVQGGNTVEVVLKTIENEVETKIPAIYHQPQPSETLHKDEAKEEEKQLAASVPEEQKAEPSEQKGKPARKKEVPEREAVKSGKASPGNGGPAYQEPSRAKEVLVGKDGKILYASRARPVHFMDTNWLPDALAAEAKEYSMAKAPAHEPWEPPAKQQQARPLVKRPQEVYREEPLMEDDEAEEEEPAYVPEIREYEEPQDADTVARQLEMHIRENKIRLLVTGGCTLALLIAGFLSEYTHIGSWRFDFSSGAIPYLIANLLLLLVAVAFNLKSIVNGFRGLFQLRANSDSGIAVASAAAVIQSVAAFFFQDSVMSGQLHLYAVLAASALLLNVFGKRIMLRRIDRNFQFMTSPEQKYVVETVEKEEDAARIAGDYVDDVPVVAYQHKTEFPAEFIHLSYLPDPGNSVSQMIAPVGFLASLILLAASLLMFGSFPEALTAFTVSACICVPVANLLCVNLPLSRLSRLAGKWGGMISGYAAIEEFSQANAVVVDADDLFPKGTVELNHIKTFGTPHIDEAILEAAALVGAVGGPLGDVFEQVIKAKRSLIPKIEKIAYEDGLGVSGWSRGKKILLGSREFLTNHGVELPPRDVEARYLQAGKQVTFLATGGVAAAMFVLTYHADTRRAAEMTRMERNGIAVMIRTCDHNITPGLIAACFEVDGRMVRVLPSSVSDTCRDAMDAVTPRSPAVMLTKGRPMTMMRLLAAAVRQKSNVTISVLLQIIAVVLGFILVAFMTCYAGLYQLRTLSLLLYELFWVAAISIIPLLRKP